MQCFSAYPLFLPGQQTSHPQECHWPGGDVSLNCLQKVGTFNLSGHCSGEIGGSSIKLPGLYLAKSLVATVSLELHLG